VSGARDFFDHWIEHEATSTDLDSLGAKMKLARKMAETVSRVHDPLMRGEVANKVSARIGIPVADFKGLFPKSSREYVSADKRESAPRSAPIHDIAMLCLLALRDVDARNFLLAQDWREVLAQAPDSEILVRILESTLRPDDPSSVNAFMAGLSTGDEALVSAWLLQKLPTNASIVVKDWWTGLKQAAVRRQLQIAEGRMKLPRLSGGEVVALQKQILDLQEQLRELSKFSSARMLDA
jgi:hypothetical protein